MDAETGKIYFATPQELEEKEEELGRQLLPLEGKEAEELKKLSKKIRKNKVRNQSCVCGSGEKLKNCCLHLFTGSKKPHKKSIVESSQGGNNE